MVESSMRTAVFCICGAILAVILRRYCQEQSMLTALAVCTGVMAGFIMLVSPIISEIGDIFNTAGISEEYISLIFKSMAICFITQTASDICRDSGESAIAGTAELWGRGMLTVTALPLVKKIIEMVSEFM